MPLASAAISKRVHLVTGATSTVGAALVLELLRAEPQSRVYCLVQSTRDSLTAEARLAHTLASVAVELGIPDAEASALVARAVALRADLCEPSLGLDAVSRELLRAQAPFTVWQFAETRTSRDRAQLLRDHIEVTDRLLELALRMGVSCFNHVSSAYVGHGEEEVSRQRSFLNEVEWARAHAESTVVARCSGMGVPYRILRPGIVIGHSRTGGAIPSQGLVNWILQLAGLEQVAGDRLRQQPLRLVGDPDATLNLIPIDSVIEDCLAIDAAGAATHDRVFNLTNQTPPTFGEVAAAAARAAGIARIEWVEEAEALDLVSRRFHDWSRFQRTYARGPQRFARGSNQLYVSPREGKCTVTGEQLMRMARPALDAFRSAGRSRVDGKVARALWEVA